MKTTIRIALVGDYSPSVIEYARNVLGMPEAAHAETNPLRVERALPRARSTPLRRQLEVALVHL